MGIRWLCALWVAVCGRGAVGAVAFRTEAGCIGINVQNDVRPVAFPGTNTTSVHNPNGLESGCCDLCNQAGPDACQAFFTGPKHELCVLFPKVSTLHTESSPGHSSGFRGPVPPPAPPSAPKGGLDQTLVILPQTDADSVGAKCLDGSPPAVYYAPARGDENANNWVIYFKGGGWCFDETDCAARSLGILGSTRQLPHNLSDVWDKSSGPLHPNATLNPTFANYHRVLLWYCDGASFAGNVAEAVTNFTKNGTRVDMYFRGQQILAAQLAFLKKRYGLGAAENVLVTGCSAGGMATYLQADRVCEAVSTPALKKCRATGLSGFFLDHPTVSGVPLTHNRYEYMMRMQNMSGGVNQACVVARGATGCATPQANYAYVRTPFFVMNSMLDAYQMANILQVNCNFPQCNQTQIMEMAAYQQSFRSTITSIGTLTKPGNGAFLTNCVVHCGEQAVGFNAYTLPSPAGGNGAVVMQAALTSWWESPPHSPAEAHTYIENCTLQGPVNCNPSCNAA